MQVFLFILGVLVSLHVIGLVINIIFFKDELKEIKPYGQMIEVDGRKMHVYAMGSGEKTVVLLPGWGVSLPSADFGPLMRRLSEEYTVVTVEYFGVGFSEEIDTPRTNENHVNEIRMALDKAGLKPPYILMPHSASGIYSEYYASKYPEEISAMIMLDTTSSAATGKTPSCLGLVYAIAKFQQVTGLSRLIFNLVPDPKLIENGYTKKEKADYKRFNYHIINNTIIKQSSEFVESIKEVNKLPFPKDMPVIKIIAKQTVDAQAKADKDDGMGYQNAHFYKLGENSHYKVLDATHFLYHTKVDEIVTLTNAFLDDTNNKSFID